MTLFLFAALAGCATTGTPAPEGRFVLADAGKYKTEAEKQRALLLAQNDCKVKALTESATLEKSLASERGGLENLYRAREKAAEMYTSAFARCMLSAGFTQN